MILDKTRSSLWKLELGFWTCGLMRLLGPNCQKLVSSPQVPSVTFLGIKHWNFCNKLYNQKVKCLTDNCLHADKKFRATWFQHLQWHTYLCQMAVNSIITAMHTSEKACNNKQQSNYHSYRILKTVHGFPARRHPQ